MFTLSFRCYNECRQGRCSGSPRFECECSLGWTSDPATLVLSGVECDVDCGCNFHSTCITAPGICDQCQGKDPSCVLTLISPSFSKYKLLYFSFLPQTGQQGRTVSTARPGSFGSALAGGEGCIPCQCNGHGDALQGFCHNQTGQCYCTHHTQGPHCESCLPGYYGDPR